MWNPSDKVECTICGTFISKANIASHRKKIHKEFQVYKEPNTYKEPYTYKEPNKELDTNPKLIQMEHFEKTIIELVDKVNIHSSDIRLLKTSNNSLVFDVKAMKEELSKQHRRILRISEEYHNGEKSRKEKIINVVQKHTGGTTSNVLQTIESVTGALKASIERTDNRLNMLIERMDKLEAVKESDTIKMNSIDNENKGLRKDNERHEGRLDKIERKIISDDDRIHSLEDKMASNDEVITMMKEFLKKEGYSISKEECDYEECSMTGGSFSTDMTTWMNNVRLRNKVLTQKGVNALKKIFDTYSKKGQLKEMMNYIDKLPSKLTRDNLKKVETRKALITFTSK